MRLLCKVGAYAGQVVNYSQHAGENLLQNGMAERLPDDWVDPNEVETADTPPGDTPEWPLATPPEKYLERSPDGPKADLARKIIGR